MLVLELLFPAAELLANFLRAVVHVEDRLAVAKTTPEEDCVRITNNEAALSAHTLLPATLKQPDRTAASSRVMVVLRLLPGS